VATGGIAGNWLWWNAVTCGALTVFFFARLWRRSGVMTDIELSELRYSGLPAAFLRGFRALYFGLPVNCIVLGWVNLAAVKILMLTLGVGKLTAIGVLIGVIAVTAAISTLSGLWGVLVTDAIQFAIAMGMVIVLAFASVDAVGGIDAMKAKLAALDSARGAGSVLNFVPDLDSAWMPLMTFLVYISLNWWASWYPGAEPGGGGFIAQRMLCARDEKHSLLATLWFNVAHYSVRPWPWILTALASMILYPGLADPETGYVRMMIDHLPPYLRGLMVAAFAAAYMSTIATELNWGASYLVNDFYKRFVRRDASERHYVLASRIATLIITILSAVITFYMDSIAGAWKWLLAIGAGTGGVLLARWYWWRVNAWSEVSSMIAAFVVSIVVQVGLGWSPGKPLEFARTMIVTVAVTTAVWIAVTFATKPEPREVLVAFYRKVRPAAFGWGPVAREAPDVPVSRDTSGDLLCFVSGCVLIYCSLFGVGKLLLKETSAGVSLLALAFCGGAAIYWNLSRRGWGSVID